MREKKRQREIRGHSGDDRYCSHVGVDPFIALPTKADNGAKTQGTERGLYGPICVSVYMCVCAVVVWLEDHDSPGRVPTLTAINDSGASMDEQVSEWLNDLIHS